MATAVATTLWKRVPIEEVYSGLYDGPHATPPPADDGPIFLGIKNLTDDGHLDLSDIRHVAESDYATWTRRVEPQPGDIVFTYEATLNRYAIIPPGFRGCLGRRLALIRPNLGVVDTRFLFYYFFSEDWLATITKNTLAGATVDRIPLTRFPTFEISLPPLPTQRHIADILSAYDDLIANNARRIAILEEMARALYREWFVEFRFPGHEDVPMVESAIGLVPKGWEVRKFSDIATTNPTTRVPKDGEKPFVPMGSLANDSMLISNIERRSGNSGSKFTNGDTLFARITPCLENGKTGFVQFLPSDTSVAFGSTEFIVMRAKTVSPEYVYLTARSDSFRGNAIKSMTGATGRQRVQDACFDTFLVTEPDQSVLGTFSEHIRPIFRFIHVLAQQVNVLRRTRDMLLPKLIAGEIRVHSHEAILAGS